MNQLPLSTEIGAESMNLSRIEQENQEDQELFADAVKILKKFGIIGIDSLDDWQHWKEENDDIILERRIAKALCELYD